MKEIHIAQMIQTKRKERRLTQDDIAEYIGVSKASVSKWETGQSYPDITFLPELAAFFNISIDELMGYQPQMSRDEIRRLYGHLAENFASKPFDEVHEECGKYIRKYYSCFPLLLQMSSLLVNHSMLAGSAEQTQKVLEEARELAVRVRSESDDGELVKQAENIEALCLLSLGRPEEVLAAMGMSDMIVTPRETLLSTAYRMSGRGKEAKAVCQVGIYQYMLVLVTLLSTYQELCVGEQDVFEETGRRIAALENAFRLKELHPAILLRHYLSVAQGYMAFGNTDSAYEYLEQYAELVLHIDWPLKLHGDAWFDMVDDWLENMLVLGKEMPRDEKLVSKSLVEALSGNPAFAALAGEARFQEIIRRMTGREQTGGVTWMR